ncbi:hypothetical protein KRR40_24675 [Niabella defluvii]|nr:hypothetical protein KRR40_24675 [Niabella sp. I65]
MHHMAAQVSDTLANSHADSIATGKEVLLRKNRSCLTKYSAGTRISTLQKRPAIRLMLSKLLLREKKCTSTL